MSVLPSALKWLQPTKKTAPFSSVSRTRTEESPAVGASTQPLSSLSQNKPQRQIPPVVTLDDLVKDTSTCCKKLSCVETFLNNRTGYNASLLKEEQARMAAFTARVDHKRFVADRVPVLKLETGSMMAAGAPVCTYCSQKIFGVSKNLIDSTSKFCCIAIAKPT